MLLLCVVSAACWTMSLSAVDRRGCAPSETTTASEYPLNGLRRWDDRISLDVCGRVGRALRALSTAVGMVSRRDVGVVGCFCCSSCSTRCVHVAASALCGVRRRFSAERRHLTALGCCRCCNASRSTARAAYVDRAARLVRRRVRALTTASEWPPSCVACLRLTTGWCLIRERVWRPLSRAVGVVARRGIWCRWLLLPLLLFSMLNACRGVCVVWVPTFQCQTSPHRSWLLLLLRCFLFDGTCRVCGSRGGPSVGL
jgi:hypothetical protein